MGAESPEHFHKLNLLQDENCKHEVVTPTESLRNPRVKWTHKEDLELVAFASKYIYDSRRIPWRAISDKLKRKVQSVRQRYDRINQKYSYEHLIAALNIL